MSEFNKIKIGFALALLGTIFTLNPIINAHGSFSYPFLGFSLKLNYIYWTFSSLLGVSVYFYAISLINKDSFLNKLNRVGNYTYATALIIPSLYVFLFFLSEISSWLIKVTKHTEIIISLNAVVSILALLLSFSNLLRKILKAFYKADKSEKMEELSEKENKLIFRAKKLFKDGYYSMSIIEAWKAIEISIKKSLVNIDEEIKKESGYRLVKKAIKKGLISKEIAEELDFVRELRNQSAHSETEIDEKTAKKVFHITDLVIASLKDSVEECYYCGKVYPFELIEFDDTVDSFVCEKCNRKYADKNNE